MTDIHQKKSEFACMVILFLCSNCFCTLAYVLGIRKFLRLGQHLLVLHSAGETADHAGQPQGLDLLPGAGALHCPLAAALQGSAQVEPGPGWNCASISPLRAGCEQRSISAREPSPLSPSFDLQGLFLPMRLSLCLQAKLGHNQ